MNVPRGDLWSRDQFDAVIPIDETRLEREFVARIKQIPVLVDISENVFRKVIQEYHSAGTRKQTKSQKRLISTISADAEIGDAAFEFGSKYCPPSILVRDF